MSHFTSLLMFLMSAVNNVAALPNVRSSMPEARSGPRPWEERYGAVSPKSFHPNRPDGIRGPQAPSSLIDPKSFNIVLQGPPPDQDVGSSQVYAGKYDNQNKHPKDSKPGWNFKFSFPFFTTTEAPTTKSDVKNVFRYLGSSQGKLYPPKYPGIQKQDNQKPNPPKQTQLVKFLDQLLQERSSEQSGQTQHDKVIFKPLMQQQLAHGHTFGSFSSPYNPNLYGMGHAHSSGSSDAGSGTHTPVYSSAHYNPKWLQLNKPQTSDDLVKKIDGQFMIPIDKCPGLEEYLKGYYHQHGKFPYGYIHQHGQPPKVYTQQQGKLPQTPVYQHGESPYVYVQHGKPSHVHVYQHEKPFHVQVDQQISNTHGHVYKPWMPPPTSPTYPTVAKPNYAEFYQYGGGPAPKPTESSQEQNDYLKWLLNKYQGHQQHPKPGQTYTYSYQEPDKPQQSGEQPRHFYYRVPSVPNYKPPEWR